MAWNRERPHSFKAALEAARQVLGASNELVAKGTIGAESETLVIAAYRAATGKLLSRAELYARIQDRYPDVAGDRLLAMAGTRAEGKPLQHVTGVQVFLDHEYDVGPDVLIPRPETEVMVSLAIEELRRRSAPPRLAAEIGIGSGAISVELLAAFPSLKIVATELTVEAMARARANASRILGEVPARERLRIARVGGPREVWQPLEAELGPGTLDLVISNPPYLAEGDPIETEVRAYEPGGALFAPVDDPLHFYRELASGAERYLRPGGMLLAELAPERAVQVLELFGGARWKARLIPDLTGRIRVLFASWSESG
jgi:release factor glutamine methyltransferase